MKQNPTPGEAFGSKKNGLNQGEQPKAGKQDGSFGTVDEQSSAGPANLLQSQDEQSLVKQDEQSNRWNSVNNKKLLAPSKSRQAAKQNRMSVESHNSFQVLNTVESQGIPADPANGPENCMPSYIEGITAPELNALTEANTRESRDAFETANESDGMDDATVNNRSNRSVFDLSDEETLSNLIKPPTCLNRPNLNLNPPSLNLDRPNLSVQMIDDRPDDQVSSSSDF